MHTRSARTYCGLFADAMHSAADFARAALFGNGHRPLTRATLSGDPRREVLVLARELAPGAHSGRHSHRGEEFSTVLQGTFEIRVDGEPPLTVHAGEAYHVAEGVVHECFSVGDSPARTMTTYVIARGKPLTYHRR